MVFKDLKRKSNEFYDEIKRKLKVFFDLIFDDWPKKPINLPSLRKKKNAHTGSFNGSRNHTQI